ncbi:hypothetical protein ACFSTD_14345 [Novosphingobium colocasiae]
MGAVALADLLKPGTRAAREQAHRDQQPGMTAEALQSSMALIGHRKYAHGSEPPAFARGLRPPAGQQRGVHRD